LIVSHQNLWQWVVEGDCRINLCIQNRDKSPKKAYTYTRTNTFIHTQITHIHYILLCIHSQKSMFDKHIHTHARFTHTYILTSIHTHARNTHTYILTCIQSKKGLFCGSDQHLNSIRICGEKHMYIHTRTNTCTHKHIMHTYTHIHVYIWGGYE